MKNSLVQIAPQDIEKRSFQIIENEFEQQTGRAISSINPSEFKVIQRVIHATGDFSFGQNLIFHQDAVERGIAAIRTGRNIFIDVTMGASGISRSLLAPFGGAVLCTINDKGISEAAQRNGKTRTETALRKGIGKNIGILAVGNAPTALLAAMTMIEHQEIKPDLVIGVPVGFVNAEESKELLTEKNYPFITSRGRKGGSPVAVAIINALLRLA